MAFLVNSVQGKDSWGLADVRGRVFGGKGGQGKVREGGHLFGSTPRAPALSLALCSERKRREVLSRLG
jgi:hypothetical protein